CGCPVILIQSMRKFPKHKDCGTRRYDSGSVLSRSFSNWLTSSSVAESFSLQIVIRRAERLTFSEIASTDICPSSISETICCSSSNASAYVGWSFILPGIWELSLLPGLQRIHQPKSFLKTVRRQPPGYA